ncbi:MAG: heme exporter protein CcmD [Gammaproteobacteria bacterium]|nr:MAG: heme exporter protein CcmD [Gammaproteobacteria bacterium]TND06212.1 MAG: heme exporter protein CcmD [Gammaproteobacteria bacterium]
MAEFFAMGGYGFFIWMSYGVTALFMVTEVLLLMRRRRTILQRLSRIRRAKIGVSHEAQT